MYSIWIVVDVSFLYSLPEGVPDTKRHSTPLRSTTTSIPLDVSIVTVASNPESGEVKSSVITPGVEVVSYFSNVGCKEYEVTLLTAPTESVTRTPAP